MCIKLGPVWTKLFIVLLLFYLCEILVSFALTFQGLSITFDAVQKKKSITFDEKLIFFEQNRFKKRLFPFHEGAT